MRFVIFIIWAFSVNSEASIECSRLLQIRKASIANQLNIQNSLIERFQTDAYVQNLAFDLKKLNASTGRLGFLKYGFVRNFQSKTLEIYHISIDGIAIGNVSRRSSIDVARFVSSLVIFIENQFLDDEQEVLINFSALQNTQLKDMIVARVSSKLKLEISESYAGANIQLKFTNP